MKKKINLEEIIDEHYDEHYRCNYKTDYSKQFIKEVMKEACKQVLELAAEHAIVAQEPVPAYEFVVVKQSILDTINQVE